MFRHAERALPHGQRGSSANRERHCCLLILRKRLCDRVLYKKRKNSVFASGWLSARFDTGISDVWMYNYASVVRVLYKYAIGVRGVGWRDGYMMRICVLYRLYICFISLLAKSRDAKSCVSRLGKPIFIGGNMLMEIEFVACETQDFASLQAGIVVIVREKGWRVVADGDLG